MLRQSYNEQQGGPAPAGGSSKKTDAEDKPDKILAWTHQIILLVAHLGSVAAHAVHSQQQVQEGKGGVQP